MTNEDVDIYSSKWNYFTKDKGSK